MATIQRPTTSPTTRDLARPARARRRAGDLVVLGFLLTASVVVLAALASGVA